MVGALRDNVSQKSLRTDVFWIQMCSLSLQDVRLCIRAWHRILEFPMWRPHSLWLQYVHLLSFRGIFSLAEGQFTSLPAVPQLQAGVQRPALKRAQADAFLHLAPVKTNEMGCVPGLLATSCLEPLSQIELWPVSCASLWDMDSTLKARLMIGFLVMDGKENTLVPNASRMSR